MAMYRNSCSYRGMYDRYTNADQYFKFRSEDYRILKWLLLFSLLFATDMAGTFGIANETFLISSCLLIEIAFSTIF